MKNRLLALIFFVHVAQAQQPPPVIYSLHIAAESQARAAKSTVNLIVLNPNDHTIHYEPEAYLSGTLRVDQHVWIVALRAADAVASVTVPANQFVTIPYQFVLPGDAVGHATLEVSNVSALQVVMDISQDESPTDSENKPAMSTLKQQEAKAPPTVSRIERTFANRFGFHEPMYFLYGNEAPAVKFQFSFKYRLIGEDSKFGDLIPPFRGFYFAYTQRSLWDVNASSSPFFDTSYMPELFFEWLAPQYDIAGGGFHWLGLQTGARHESNGKDGIDSRSLNIAYLRAAMMLGSMDGWKLVLTPRLFSYLGTSTDNADIARYRGYGELQLSFGKNDSTQLSVASRIGTHGTKGSIQVDVMQPIRIPLINLETFLQIQYFNGYGESLRTYDQKTSIWRLGLAFVR